MGAWGSKKNVEEPKKSVKKTSAIRNIEPVPHIVKLETLPVRKQPKLNLIQRDLPQIVSSGPEEYGDDNQNRRLMSRDTKELIMQMKK